MRPPAEIRADLLALQTANASRYHVLAARLTKDLGPLLERHERTQAALERWIDGCPCECSACDDLLQSRK